MTTNFTILAPDDDVAVALCELKPGELKGETISSSVTLRQSIPFGHKFALKDIRKGSTIKKYGYEIGIASQDIHAGDHVHVHNVSFDQSLLETTPEIATEAAPTPIVPSWAKDSTFLGYRWPDGSAGTANHVLVMSTVNCSATVVREAVSRLRTYLPQYPNVDNIVGITHGGGCGLSSGSPQHEQFARCISNVSQHPNVARSFLVSLGCESAPLRGDGLYHIEQLVKKDPLKRTSEVITIQDEGGSEAAIDKVVKTVLRWLPEVNERKRIPIPASELIVGTNCGGSDGFSGLTANPLVGKISDVLTALGATSVLAETTETWGGHLPLLKRAKSKAVGESLMERFNWWDKYFQAYSGLSDFNYTLDGNPSSGNKKGGITTIIEKSLGAATKGGTTGLAGVYLYGQKIERHKGFVFMDTPGLDQVSVTGLLCGGCNFILFTTGRGSCFGTALAPTLKIATNAEIFTHMKNDMDFDAGRLLHGEAQEVLAQELFSQMLDVASGRTKTQSQRLGYGDHEFELWNIGPTY